MLGYIYTNLEQKFYYFYFPCSLITLNFGSIPTFHSRCSWCKHLKPITTRGRRRSHLFLKFFIFHSRSSELIWYRDILQKPGGPPVELSSEEGWRPVWPHRTRERPEVRGQTPDFGLWKETGWIQGRTTRCNHSATKWPLKRVATVRALVSSDEKDRRRHDSPPRLAAGLISTLKSWRLIRSRSPHTDESPADALSSDRLPALRMCLRFIDEP